MRYLDRVSGSKGFGKDRAFGDCGQVRAGSDRELLLRSDNRAQPGGERSEPLENRAIRALALKGARRLGC
jgi:hypothetical protein